MKEICNKKMCTGCGLCVAQCPQKCIKTHHGVMGHIYPLVDEQRCTDCGICRRNCPANTEIGSQYPLKAFATWSKDKSTYKSSTSGGLATEISKHVIRQGGVVYGCASLPNVDIKHVRVDSLDDLALLQGSKYVQSNIIEIIPLLKKDVKDGRLVCFIGTPCQTAAIKNIYKRGTDNLLLIDIICHGVPSLEVLRKHVRSIEGNSPVDKVLFRKQNDYGIYIYSKGKETYSYTLFEKRFYDCYINAFYDAFTFRDSCYECKYAQQKRISDMTIGDFWGLGTKQDTDEIPEHNNGCSLALPSTEKGLSVLKIISNNLNIYERTVQEAVDGNEQLQHPARINKRIKIYRFTQRFGYMPWIYHILMSDIILWPKVRGLFKKIKKHIIWQK